MSALTYYLCLPLVYGIAWLPFPLLYALSDLCFVLVYHVMRYRRGVVRANLSNAFPEKDAAEIRKIERAFYRWFCDLWLETLKTLTIRGDDLDRRVVVDDDGVLRHHFSQGRSVILVMGHLGNWELGGARFARLKLHPLNVIYHPLSNPYFERLIARMRTRSGNGLYAMRDTLRNMLRDRDKITATAFITDQSPPPESAHWTTFLQQPTAVFNGVEKIARKLNYPVLYVSIIPISRGRYSMSFDALVTDPSNTSPGKITDLHTRRLEQDIRDHPSHWLWTHRRWKHAPPENRDRPTVPIA